MERILAAAARISARVMGVAVPGDIQGRSFLPILQGATPPDWRQSMYYRYYDYPGAHRVQPHYGVRTERYKLIYFNKIKQTELFDLQKDPREMKNLYSDPAHAKTIARLKKRLAELQAFYKDTPAE